MTGGRFELAAAPRAPHQALMIARLSFIGFGEAAQAFRPALRAREIMAYDRKTHDSSTRSAKFSEYDAEDVVGCPSIDEALADCTAALSLVTADQCIAAAKAAAALSAGSFWFDMNSAAPETKRAAAAAIEARGGRYVDVAIMAPVAGKGADVPLLISGPWAEEGAAFLSAVGFGKITLLVGPVGAASSVKMIRSVMIKGIEALSAECALAAHAAGVLDEIVVSLDASWPGADWAARFDYNLDRMIVHGARRAAEMGEVAATLDALGVSSVMSRATAACQRAIGAAAHEAPAGLRAKLDLLSLTFDHS